MAEATPNFNLVRQVLDNIHKTRLEKDHIPPEKAGEELLTAMHADGLCNVSPTVFLSMMSPPQWKLFGEEWTPQLHLTGSSTENLTYQDYRHVPIMKNMTSDYDLMIVLGNIKDFGETENTHDSGFIQVLSSYETPLTTKLGENYHLDPSKVLLHTKSVIYQAFNNEHFEIKVNDDSADNELHRPAVTIRTKPLSQKKEQSIMLDIVPALDTGEKVRMTQAYRKSCQSFVLHSIENQSVLAVCKSKSSSMQWRLSYSLAERDLFRILYKTRVMTECVKLLKSKIATSPDAIVQEYIKSYHIKTASCHCVLQSGTTPYNEQEFSDTITFLCEGIKKNHLPAVFNEEINLFDIPEEAREYLVAALLKTFSRSHNLGMLTKSKEKDEFTDFSGEISPFIRTLSEQVHKIEIERGNSVEKTLPDNEDTFTAMMEATAKEDAAVLQQILKNPSTDVNQSDKDGITPLLLAAHRGNIDLADLLIAHNADVNQSDCDTGRTALQVAINNGNIELTGFLVKHNADVNQPDREGITPLHIAAVGGHSEIANLLINHGANMNQRTNVGETPLWFAAAAGHQNTVELLLQQNADVNQVAIDGRPALCIAAAEGHREVSEVLLKYGANANQSSKDGRTALHTAAQTGKFHTLELLIQHNGDVNHSDNRGRSPLHFSAMSGYAEIAELLLKQNANVNQVDISGTTALHTAAQKNNLEMADILIKYNADVNQYDSNGITTLQIAAERGMIKLAELLLKYKANVNQANKKGSLPIHLATASGHKEFTELLIKHKSYVNCANNDGRTPLHYAAVLGHFEIAELLLRCNANVNQCDKGGRTPLLYAEAGGHTTIAELLRQDRSAKM